MHGVAMSQQVYFNNIYDYFGNQETGFSVLAVNGGYYIAGAAKDSSFWQRIEILHIDSIGNEVWKKSYGKQNHQYYPGIGESLIPTFDGGYALGGSVLKPTGDDDAILYKFDANGDTLWTRMYGDSLFQIAYKCIQTSDKGYILIGTSNNGNDNDIMLLKTDSIGNTEWQKMYGGSNQQRGIAIDKCYDKGYIIGGSTWSSAKGYDAYVIKTDSMGNQQWAKNFGGDYDDCGANIIQTADSGYIFAICINQLVPPNLTPNFSRNYIYKLDAFGNVLWTKPFGPLTQGGGTSFNSTFHELNDGSFFIAGQLIDPQYAMRGWLLKINAQGDSLWDRRYDKFYESDDRFLGAIPTDDGGFIAVGDNYYFGLNDTGMLAGNRQNLWVLKIDSCGCVYSGCDTTCTGDTTDILDIHALNVEFRVYPNPTSGNITVVYSLPFGIKNATIIFYDLMGKRISSYEIQNSSRTINLGMRDFSNGIYYCVFWVEGEVLARNKIVVTKR